MAEYTATKNRSVVDASDDMLLVYAPSSELLGTMWAAYRIHNGKIFYMMVGFYLY